LPRFRKKPVEIEAVQWTGENGDEICDFLRFGTGGYIDPKGNLVIRTLEGALLAREGDWIIRGVQGEHYPCKPDIFAETYEPVE